MDVDLADTLVASDDDRLLQAQALVRAYCGWHIAGSRIDDTATVQPAGAVLILPTLWLTAVKSVTVDGTAVDSDSYRFTRAGVVTRTYGWWSCVPVAVTFAHGHEDPPPEVTGVVQSIAQRAVDNPGSVVRQTVGPFSETFTQTGFNQASPLVLLAGEKDILDHYRLPSRP